MMLFILTNCCVCVSLFRRTGGSSTGGGWSFSSSSSENKRRLQLSARAASVLALLLAAFAVRDRKKGCFAGVENSFSSFSPQKAVGPNTKESRALARGIPKKLVNLCLLWQLFVTQRSRLVSRLSYGLLS